MLRLRVATLVLLLAAAGCRREPVALDLGAIADSLARFGQEDQAGRERIPQAVTDGDTVFLARLMQQDSARSLWLRALVARQGWPVRSRVGDPAAQAAWLILQHTPLVGFQEEMLPRVTAAAEQGEIPKAELALLVDRIRVRAGQPQLYGSSFHVADGKLVADPVDDIARLDERRAAMGMSPIAEYVRGMGELYRMPVVWPPKPE